MENLDIQNLWKQNETLLEANRKLNLILLKEMKLDKAKSSLFGLLFLPITTLIFYTIIGFYAIYFAVEHAQFWYFAFSGAVVTFFSFWLVWSSIKQLKLILSIDYTEAVVKIQQKLSMLKTAIVLNFRIVAWLLPFGPFVGLFFVKAIFNIDLMVLLNFNMIISFGIATIILEIVSLLLLRALHQKRFDSKWLNWLLLGSGSQINDALQYLKSIEDFQKETSK
ncbi:conserved membrane protein of unknown function [Tenacibaculum soleae]|uniref:hypothetical protein n=1 Tax=Tenacibaculum soleae TaxID=447689 RepID=UPI003AB4E692